MLTRFSDIGLTLYNDVVDSCLTNIYETFFNNKSSKLKQLEFNGDVLKINVQDKGTWLFNKHQTSRQLWVSSPITGAARYNYSPDFDVWLNQKDYKNPNLIKELKNKRNITDALTLYKNEINKSLNV
eukprot:GAHX01001936.1.p1 GENE.GAHX01001936.1~~GAHX01001936.1.p1  ORF type:complete len:127 (+),score=25.64 GAHX01001936.1:58-438(+)